MKNLLIKLFSLVIVSMLITSCEDQGESIFGDGELGANLKAPSTGAFLRGETEMIDMNLVVTSNEGVSVESIVIYGELNTLEQVNDSTREDISSGVVELATVTNDGMVTFTTDELFASLPVDGEVKNEDELYPGDTFVFTYELNLADGRVMTIAGNYTVTFTCPSDLGGKYLNTTEVSASDFGAQSFSYEVELVDLGAGRYTVEDMTGGMWSSDPYAAEYATTARTTTLVEVCGQITLEDAPDQFGGFITTEGQPGPSYDPETGVITWGWTDTLYGETGITTYTPVGE